MKSTQKQGIQGKLTLLLKSKNVQDIAIAEELIIANAKDLDRSYIDNFITTRGKDIKETDFLVRLKRKLPGFKIIDLL